MIDYERPEILMFDCGGIGVCTSFIVLFIREVSNAINIINV
jgi:hypothetical protein